MRKHTLYQIVSMLFFLLGAIPVWSQQTMVIDTRLMLLNHPLVHQFDPKTRRFKGTISEPVDGPKGLEQLRAEIKTLSDQLGGTLTAAKTKGQTQGFIAQRRENIKSALHERLEMLKRREIEASSVPGRLGMTIVTSIIPTIRTISDDMKTIIQKLQQKHGCQVVVDQAALVPLDVRFAPDPDRIALNTNAHFLWWRRGIAQNDPSPFHWVDQAKQFWLKEPSFPKIVCPYGAKDLTLEAANMMRTLWRKQ